MPPVTKYVTKTGSSGHVSSNTHTKLEGSFIVHIKTPKVRSVREREQVKQFNITGALPIAPHTNGDDLKQNMEIIDRN